MAIQRFSDIVRPAVADVVLAAAVAVRIVEEHRAVVLDARRLVLAVGEDLVGRRQVAQGLEVGRHRGGKRVERDVLAAVGPDQVAADPEQHLVREHHLDDGAGLDALPRVDIAGPAVLVAAEHAAGHLAVESRMVWQFRSAAWKMLRVFRLLVVDRRAAEALRDVHVVPVGHAVGPVGRVAMDLCGQFQQPRLAGAVVEPVDAGQVVARPLLLPEGEKEILLRHRQLPVEVLRHQLEHALVAGVLVVRLQGGEHDHVGPQVGLALDGRSGWPRAEVAVVALAGDGRLDPGLASSMIRWSSST